jgi:hypothetical protein
VIVERPALERRVLGSLDAGRIPVILGGCAAGRTSLLLRLRAWFGQDRAQYIDVAAAATTPERCTTAIRSAAPSAVARGGGSGTYPSARAAFDALTDYFVGATAGEAPVTFLLDEVLDIRTFESFPGLRHVQRELVTRLAQSQNAFVLTSRFTARAHRLLRDAPARFEVIHLPPLDAEDVQLLGRQSGDDDRWTTAVAAEVAALSAGRAGYAALLLQSLRTLPTARRTVDVALASALSPDGALTARCRESYEFRLQRARGYGALKAILGILAEQESLTLTEISQRMHRTPGSTKDYLSWLEDVDLVTVHRKRYTFSDPLLRLYVRLYGQSLPPAAPDILREVAEFTTRVASGPDAAGAAAPPRQPVMTDTADTPAAAGAAADRSGIIEID